MFHCKTCCQQACLIKHPSEPDQIDCHNILVASLVCRFQALAGVCGMCLCRAFSPCADIFQDSQYQDMGYERYTSPRAHVESLLKQRDDMEAEMEAIAGSLTVCNPAK